VKDKTVEVASNVYNAAVSGAEVVAEKAVEFKDAAIESGKVIYNKTAEVAVDVKDKVV